MEYRPVPRDVPEKETLWAFLRQNRAVLVWKTEGMSDEHARQAPFESDLSMIGIVQHLAIVETSWFHEIFAGREVDYRFDFDADIDAEWHLRGSETLADALAWYTAAAATSDEIIDGADFDGLSVQERDGERFSLRWIVAHMIEETARHTGHADVLREHLDHTLGYLP